MNLEALLDRYDKPGPRYTSYPTAPVWREEFGAEQYAQALRNASASDEELSLYAHVPFCEQLCWFCGCTTIITQRHDKEQPYVDRVLREADLVQEQLGSNRRVAQHHWGGGTPTFLGPDEIARLFLGLCERFPLSENAEVSIEVDPRVTTPEQLETLRRVGFNRISMGVQDFNPVVQQAIHREQSFEQTEAIVQRARDLGFISVNLDLIYGLPHQSEATFRASLNRVHELRPDRIACYSYAHVPWLKKHQRVIQEDALPLGAEKLRLYLAALESFGEQGYDAIGMDHFALHEDEISVAARNGKLHRNFMGYTTHPAEDMISFGMSAISEVDGAFAHNEKELRPWGESIDANTLPTTRGLKRSGDDERRRRIILDLMCRFRLRFADHGGSDEFHRDFAIALDQLEPMAADDLCVIDTDGITVTETGRLFVRNLCMPFDAYLQPDQQRFSRTV